MIVQFVHKHSVSLEKLDNVHKTDDDVIVDRQWIKTSEDSKAVDDADSPVLVNHLQRYSKQQLKYQVSYDVCIATTATNISS